MPCVHACQHAKSVPTFHFYVPTCQRRAIFQICVPTCQKACQFFNYFSKEKIFQLWLTFANFKNIWVILENSSRETKNLNFDICLFLLTCYKSCISSLIYHAHHKPCWKSIHYVRWIRNYFRNNSTRKHSHKKRKEAKETWRNKVTIMFLITISDLQLKQITIQEDHNIGTCSLFCLVVLAVENSRKPLFVTCNV